MLHRRPITLRSRRGRWLVPAVALVAPIVPMGAASASTPASPPDASTATSTFVQIAPTFIADVAVTTSTLDVSGVDPYLWDLDVSTNIAHTFSAGRSRPLTRRP